MAAGSSLPRCLRRTLAALGGAAVVGIILAVVRQGTTPPESGAADPLIGIRRPLVRAATSVGILAEPPFLSGTPWLPTRGGSTLVTTTGEGVDRVRLSIATTHKPVYRPIWRRVGERVTIRLEGFALHECERVRLVTGRGSESTVLDEATVALDAAPLLLEGYVADADGTYSIDVLRKNDGVWESLQSRNW